MAAIKAVPNNNSLKHDKKGWLTGTAHIENNHPIT